MGDERHKESPPPASEEEDVTPAFISAVRELLDVNLARNRLTGAKPGAPDYLVSTQAELAKKAGVDPNELRRMIGPVNPGTVWTNRIYRSTKVRSIRDALGLPSSVSIVVKETREASLRGDGRPDRRRLRGVGREVQAAQKARPRTVTATICCGNGEVVSHNRDIVGAFSPPMGTSGARSEWWCRRVLHLSSDVAAAARDPRGDRT